MNTVKIELTQEEKELADSYAKKLGVSLSEAMKSTFFERIEDEYDIALADEAINEYEKDPTSYSLEETRKILGL